MTNGHPAPFDADDDAFAEALRIHALGEQSCTISPWNELDEAERAVWLPRGRRYREAIEARGVIVTARKHLQ